MMIPASEYLEVLHPRVAACDSMHHYYHYIGSWMHLCYAQHLRQIGDDAGARKQFKAALFQDHLNVVAQAALEALKRTSSPLGGEGGVRGKTTYDTHITSGAVEALRVYEASLGWEPDSSMEWMARDEFAEALHIFGGRHERYHRHASGLHQRRAELFLQMGQADLAINDLTKALDLDRHNQEAMRLRASLYAERGSRQLAEADELRLARLAAL